MMKWLRGKYDPSDDYLTLRIVADVMMLFGFATMFFGFVFSVGMYYSVRVPIALLLHTTDGLIVLGASFIVAVMSFLFAGFMGLLQIAASQVIKVILDMRDDTRRMYLIASKSQTSK